VAHTNSARNDVVSYVGEEGDPVKLTICTRWQSAECHEREDEESYPCNDIKAEHRHQNEQLKTFVKFLIECYRYEGRESCDGNGQP